MTGKRICEVPTTPLVGKTRQKLMDGERWPVRETRETRETSHVLLHRELADIGDAWGALARTDPLWAICVDPAGKNGRWDPAAFHATGAVEVTRVLGRAETLGLPVSGSTALDFGCGAGRLTRPLAARFDLAVGVDIAQEMLDLAARDNPVANRCKFIRNTAPDLSLFGDSEFDLVYTSMVLQHLPPRLARVYLAEFARVLRPGGALIVHLPTSPRLTIRGVAYRVLPPSALGLAQRRLLGYPALMRMHGLPERAVRELLAGCGLEVLAADREHDHPDWHEVRYFCRKRS